MAALVSSALAAAELHSLSPPCDHSADTPGPFMPQPGALSLDRFRCEGLSRGSPSLPVEKPRMFSASYQRYSEDGETGGWGDGETELMCRYAVRRHNTRLSRTTRPRP